jgi:hypothetical protein
MVLGAAVIRYGHTLLLGIVIPLAGMGFGLLLSNICPRRCAEQFMQLARAETTRL